MNEPTGNPEIARHLGGQAAYVLAGNGVTVLVALPLQVFVARMLGADGLGVFGLMEAGMGLLAGLLGFGLAPMLVRFVPELLAHGAHDSLRTLISRGARILAAAGVAAFLVIVLLLPWVADLWPRLANYRSALVLMALTIPIGLCGFYFQEGLRGMQAIRYLVFGASVLQPLVKAALAILLLLGGFELLGYVGAVVSASLMTCLWMLVGLNKRVAGLPDNEAVRSRPKQRPATKRWSRYALTQYQGSLLGLGAQYLDRFLIGIFAGLGSVGVLAVVTQLQNLPVVFLRMLLAVAGPMFAAAHARGDAQARQHVYHLATDWVVRAGFPLLVFLAVTSDQVLRIYGVEFAEKGSLALIILVAGQSVNLAYGPVGNLLNMCDMEKSLLRLTMIQTMFTVVGLAVFVPWLGLPGAALSITLGIVFHNVAAYRMARETLGIIWWNPNFGKWFLPMLAATAVAIGTRQVAGGEHHIVALLAGLVVTYGVVAVIYLAQGLNDDDKALLELLRGRLHNSFRGSN